MAKGRKSKTYVDGPRKQMTLTWKRLVHTKLADRKKTGLKPGSVGALSTEIPCDKAGLTRALDLTRDPQQMSLAEKYMDRICEILDIPPPLVEAGTDAQLEQEIDVFRGIPAEERALILDPEIRKALSAFAKRRS